jgi:chromosome segregation ATPase
MTSSSESLGDSVDATTSSMVALANSLDSRESHLTKRKRRLAQLREEQSRRVPEIDSYADQIQQRAEFLKQQQRSFATGTSVESISLQSRLSEAADLYQSHVRKLKDLHSQKADLEREVSSLSSRIDAMKTEQTDLEQQDSRAEETIYEYVVKPFSRFEMGQILREFAESHETAVKTLLDLQLKLIHDLRTEISEMKLRIEVQKNEFQSQLLKFPLLPVPSFPVAECRNRNDKLNRRIARMDNEIRDIQLQIPELQTEIADRKTDIKRISEEITKSSEKLAHFQTQFNPSFNSRLQGEIAGLRMSLRTITPKVDAARSQNEKLVETRLALKRKLRQLVQEDLELDHTDLQVQAEMNAIQRRGLELKRDNQEEEFQAMRLGQELAQLQERMAAREGEFEMMVRSRTVLEIEDRPAIPEASSCKRLSRSIRHLHSGNLQLLASVRSCHEQMNFLQGEIHSVQGRLYLAECRAGQARVSRMETDEVESALRVDEVRERIAKLHAQNQTRAAKVRESRDWLTRIEAMNGFGRNFVVHDSEKVADRLDLRAQRVHESAGRVQHAQGTLRGFQEFYQMITDEIHAWKRGSPGLQPWLAHLRRVCQSFRSCGL